MLSNKKLVTVFSVLGVAIGCIWPALSDVIDTGALLDEFGFRKVRPYFIPRIVTNLTGGHISLKYGLKV